MSQPDVDAMAAEVVLLVKSALAPVMERLIVADVRLAQCERTASSVVAVVGEDIGELRERVAVVETKASIGPPQPLTPDLAPVQQQIAVIDAQIADLSRRLQDDSLTKELGTLRERVAVVETKAVVTVAPVPAIDVPPAVPDIAPEDLSASFTGLLTKELETLGGSLARPLIQRRVVRDADGKIARVVEEPAA